jgi:hypothetical protein
LLNVILAVLTDKPSKEEYDAKKKEEIRKKIDDFIILCKHFKIDDPEIQKEDEDLMN